VRTIFIFLFCLFCVNPNLSYADFSDLQKLLNKIQEAERKKLPKTAIKYALELEKKARADGEKGMYIRALTKKILNKANYTGEKSQNKILILRSEIQKADKRVRPVLEAILAIWFWQYYERNRYLFRSRGQTSGVNDSDFSTWDLPKIYNETSKLFDISLKQASVLKKIRIKEYRGLIDQGNLPEKFCRTLYEFLLREAIRFYKADISSLPAPENDFEIYADTEAFGNYKKFIKFRPKTDLQKSHKLKALKLYQKLVSFYLKIQGIKIWGGDISHIHHTVNGCIWTGYNNTRNRIFHVSFKLG